MPFGQLLLPLGAGLRTIFEVIISAGYGTLSGECGHMGSADANRPRTKRVIDD